MKRFYKDGYPNHVYSKGVGGNMVFYSTADCIYYITLYFCLSRRHRIRTSAFSLMPNHTHSQQQAPNKKAFISFNQKMASVFTRGYNTQHNREGELFQKPFGSAPKAGEKSVRNNLSYICNNGAAGNLSKGVTDYRWNLMAYYCNDHPYSEKIILAKASHRLRNALRYVDQLCEEEKPLSYKVQRMLFKGLNKKERLQLTDYFITKYNFLDYSLTIKLFGTFEKAIEGMNAHTGSEHDLKEEWEDYSEYRRMIEMAGREGLDMESVNFEKMDRETLLGLVKKLSRVSRDSRKILRFIGRGKEVADR